MDWFILPSHNLTDESESGLTFHHSRLMGLDDLLNTVSTTFFYKFNQNKN